jgi:hypothetical protein
MKHFPHADLILKLHHAHANMAAIAKILHIDIQTVRNALEGNKTTPNKLTSRPPIPWQDQDANQPIIDEVKKELRRRKVQQTDQRRKEWSWL